MKLLRGVLALSLSLVCATPLTAQSVSNFLGTASVYNIGTSGATVPLLNGANTWSAINTHSAKIGINFNATALPTAQTGTILQVAQTDATSPRIELDPYGTSGFLTAVRRSGTAAAPTQVLAGEQIGGYNAMALDNAATIRGPFLSFRSYAAEPITSTNQGGIGCIAATPLATTTLADQLCVYGGTGVLIGGAAATTVPITKLEIVSTAAAGQLQLDYDATHFSNFAVSSAGALLIGTNDGAAGPFLSLSPSSGNVGINAETGQTINFQTASTTRFAVSGTGLEGNGTNAAGIDTASSSGTNPGLYPRKTALTSGIGGASDNVLDFIISATSVGQVTATGINGMAIGVSTPAAAAHTTLSANNASVIFSALGSDATHTDATVCIDTVSGLLYKGSGTVGICLGTSSRRYKIEDGDLAVGLVQVLKMHPVQYYLKEEQGGARDKILYGFYAEDEEGTLPLLVGHDAEGLPNTFDYVGVVPVLVKAMQEQQGQIEELKAQITLLQNAGAIGPANDNAVVRVSGWTD